VCRVRRHVWCLMRTTLVVLCGSACARSFPASGVRRHDASSRAVSLRHLAAHRWSAAARTMARSFAEQAKRQRLPPRHQACVGVACSPGCMLRHLAYVRCTCRCRRRLVRSLQEQPTSNTSIRACSRRQLEACRRAPWRHIGAPAAQMTALLCGRYGVRLICPPPACLAAPVNRRRLRVLR
jgi:hypothetical protein